MKLTSKSRWVYSIKPSIHHINTVLSRDEWVHRAAEILPSEKLDYLELGCAPGFYTAALAKEKPWTISGIDYSDDANLFIETISLIGKHATLYREDLFGYQIPAKFDIVASFGLVEHFRGASFETIMHLHNAYARADGYVVIAVPNFTGFPYIFHYLFDLPDLDNHNVDVMHPDTIASWLRDNGYSVLFSDYVGIMRLWGNSSFTDSRYLAKFVAGIAVGLSYVAQLLSFVGIKLVGRAWSPYLLIIARKHTA